MAARAYSSPTRTVSLLPGALKFHGDRVGDAAQDVGRGHPPRSGHCTRVSALPDAETVGLSRDPWEQSRDGDGAAVREGRQGREAREPAVARVTRTLSCGPSEGGQPGCQPGRHPSRQAAGLPLGAESHGRTRNDRTPPRTASPRQSPQLWGLGSPGRMATDVS